MALTIIIPSADEIPDSVPLQKIPYVRFLYPITDPVSPTWEELEKTRKRSKRSPREFTFSRLHFQLSRMGLPIFNNGKNY